MATEQVNRHGLDYFITICIDRTYPVIQQHQRALPGIPSNEPTCSRQRQDAAGVSIEPAIGRRGQPGFAVHERNALARLDSAAPQAFTRSTRCVPRRRRRMLDRARRLARTMRRVPFRTVVRLATLTARCAMTERSAYERFTTADDIPLALGHGRTCWIKGATAGVDLMTFLDVFADRQWRARSTLADSYVIDGGGHRGYFGAYALLAGAHHVLSIEPHPDNRATLERSASTFREQGAGWSVGAYALAIQPGVADLHIADESWAHSLIEPGLPTDTITVATRPLGDVIAETVASLTHPGSLVVKLDIEGLAADVIMATGATAWQHVDEVLVEFESSTTGSVQAALDHLDDCGFAINRHRRGHYWLTRD